MTHKPQKNVAAYVRLWELGLRSEKHDWDGTCQSAYKETWSSRLVLSLKKRRIGGLPGYTIGALRKKYRE